jgi:hypothetical protein
MFSCPSQQRKNIEGSLFLIKRRSQPRFQMLVLNKLSTGEAAAGTAAAGTAAAGRTSSRHSSSSRQQQVAPAAGSSISSIHWQHQR